MFEVIVTQGNRVEKYDLHALPINGTFCHKMRGDELYSALKAKRIPGINPTDGHQQLSLAYAKYLAAGAPKADDKGVTVVRGKLGAA